MSSVVISGDTSGAITVAAPAVSGTNTLTLQAATATSAVNTLGTVNAGGTNPFPSSGGPAVVDYTGLPAWVKKITVMFVGVSTSGTSPIQIQIGNTSPEITGYLSGAQTAGSAANITSGFSLEQSCAATSVRHGMAFISTLGSNVWSYSTITNRSDTAAISWGSGSKTTSGTLDRVRVTTVNGTDTFDAGTINILYEG
jgi:hypothetical protein